MRTAPANGDLATGGFRKIADDRYYFIVWPTDGRRPICSNGAMVVGQFALETNLVVIGGGAGGYAAALRAAKLGVDTMLVDGAVPAPGKAPGPGGGSWTGLRRLRELLRLRAQAADLGAGISTPEFTLPALQQHMRESVLEAAERREEQCRAAGVNAIQGVAQFEDARQLAIHGGPNARVRFKRVIIATGARPQPPAGGWPKSKRVSDWLGTWKREQLPKALLVVGGGSIALEMATAFSALGSSVSLCAPGPQLLPAVDPSLVQPVEKRLRETIEKVYVATTVTALGDVGDRVEAQFRGKGAPDRRVFDHVLVALGNRPHTTDLGLEKAKVKLADDASIRVNHQLRTTNHRILAIGDVTGEPMLANKAAHQAKVAAEVIAGRDSAYDPRAVPCVVHTDPPIAWCGLMKARAAATGTPHRACTTVGPSQELVSLLFDPTSKLLLGAGITGPAAAEMIGEAALAIEMGAVAGDLAATVHAQPSLSQLIAEAAGDF
ncbi:MAG: dihydrolipoyl dehydrogenase family protein [Planctomycetota bacterium]